MKKAIRIVVVVFVALIWQSADRLLAQNWPQWRGPSRDARASGFDAPKTWPEKLTKQWEVRVGDGVASPSLMDGRLYVFARDGENEVIRCLKADSGEEIWQEKSPANAVRGAAASFGGPRSTPTVADGKIVLLGVDGVLVCRDAETGKLIWEKKQYEGDVPRFATSSSPIVVDGLCIAQLGADRGGVLEAYDLATGEQKWKSAASPAYGSPILITLGDVKAIVAPTDDKLLAVNAADGTLLWEIPYTQGRYNAATPMIDGDMLFFAGPERGITAMKLEMKEGKIIAADAWKNPDNSVQFSTPVVRDDLLFGLSSLGGVFCINAKSGETAWNASLSASARPEAREQTGRPSRGRGRGGSGGYGSAVDAGSTLVALTPNGQLVVFEPRGDEFKELARYTVAERGTYAYPVLSGRAIIIKDQDSIRVWSLE